METKQILSVTPEIDVSHKLTKEDITRIEEYRRTRQTSVLTVLFTDIVNYTGFTYRCGEQASARLRHIHDELIIGEIRKEGYGEIIKQIGDSFLIVFSDPSIAVRQALKIQELIRINRENLTCNDYTLTIRIGLHMGQVSVEDHIMPDVFGTHINLAARVMSLSKAGQVLVSGSVWENASGWLKEESSNRIGWDFYGKIRLKGIGKPTEIYEFYEFDGKKGIPKILLHKKQLKVVYTVLLAVLVIAAISVPVRYYLHEKNKSGAEKAMSDRGQLIIGNINSDPGSIREATGWVERPDRNDSSLLPLAPVPAELVEKLNAEYQVLLKTYFITDFEIKTEEDLRLEYANLGKSLPADLDRNKLFDRKNIRSSRGYWIIRPFLYRDVKSNKYLLSYSIDGVWNSYRTGNNSSGGSTMFMNPDSVPVLLKAAFEDAYNYAHSENIGYGSIISVRGEEVLLRFAPDVIRPVPGVVLSTAHIYNGSFMTPGDTAVKARIRDLEKALVYYGSAEKWMLAEDTSRFYSTYAELKALRSGNLVLNAPDGLEMKTGTELMIMKVYDSTAMAKIYNRRHPWMVLRQGDRVRLK